MTKSEAVAPAKGVRHEMAYDAALYLDFYGALLTEKQAEILDFYYNEDYTLSEIAQAFGISRQAAHDAVRNGIYALGEYEDKLGMIRARQAELSGVGEAREAISDLRAAMQKLSADEGSNSNLTGRGFDVLEDIIVRLENGIARIAAEI